VLPAPEDLPFPHVSQVFLIERYVMDLRGQLISAVAALGVASPEPGLANAADLAGYVREQWSIESLHWLRSPGVPSLSHDVAPEASAGSFCNTSRGRSACCRRCSEARPTRTCHMHDNLAQRRRVDDDATTCTIR